MYSVWRNGLCSDESKDKAYRAEVIITIKPTANTKRQTIQKVRKYFRTAESARQWAIEEQKLIREKLSQSAQNLER